MASSGLLTNIPAEYSIRVLFVNFHAKSRHKPYTRPLALMIEQRNKNGGLVFLKTNITANLIV
ncbi:hypothetical protein [Pseudotamlana agarivorans]|uniref:hypothetical protein n=1 Tax=Pseudotamlana agarivorans TaxID=481183 RepID=UPI000ADE7C89|nr:hypothetical protein [Tamlana agarivorans]